MPKRSGKRYVFVFFAAVALCVLALLFSRRPGRWLMTEREVLAYYRETYGIEAEILSRSDSEYQEGDVHTRQQELILCPADQPDLEFRFSEWAGYTYSPGPIPQLWPSFSRSLIDDYPTEALVYALRQFLEENGLGTIGELDDYHTITLPAGDWEAAVKRIADCVNRLSAENPYDRIETIWLLQFRRVLPDGQEVVYRADLIDDDRLTANAGEIIAGMRAAEVRERAVLQFEADFQAFLEGTDWDFRTETGWRTYEYCHSFTVSIDVGSLAELDRILEGLAGFAESHQPEAVYTAEGLKGLPVWIHFIWRGVPEPRGQIGTWVPFAGEGRLTIDTAVLQERIRKLYLLPEDEDELENEAEEEPAQEEPAPPEGEGFWTAL